MRAMPEYGVSFDRVCGRRIEVVAASAGIWRWRFRCGDRPIRPGGGLKLFCEVPRIWMATALQTESPLQPGYVSVAAPDGVPCAIRQIPKEWKEISWATLLLPAGLRPGQEITVSFGSEPHPCHVIAHKYPYAPVSWRVDYEGEGEFYRLWPPMVIRVAPDRAAKLGLVAPSVLAPGEPVAVKGRVEDRNSNIGARYEKPIALTLERNGEPVPGCTRAVRAGERGTFGFAGWPAGESGLYRVRARAEGLPEAVSNAAQVVENPDHRG